MQRDDPLHPSEPLFIAGSVLIVTIPGKQAMIPLVPHHHRVQFQEQTLSLEGMKSRIRQKARSKHSKHVDD
jgi:hypothetical protein